MASNSTFMSELRVLVRNISLAMIAIMAIVQNESTAFAGEAPATLQVVSAVSPQFAAEVDRVWQAIPPAIRSDLQRAGWQVKLAEYVVDAAPELATQVPRGWPEGMSWRNVDAVHLPRQRLLVVAEKRLTTQGACVLATRTAGVLRHELGHAYDRANGGQAQYLSSTPLFRAAYEKDGARLSSELRERLGYYRQAGSAGRQEAFAEAFGMLLGGGSDLAVADEFSQAFPAVLQCVSEELKVGAEVAAVQTRQTPR